MKAAIVNPYLDTLGGGERYTCGVIAAFQRAGYRVDVQWPDAGVIRQLENRFGVKLSQVRVVESVNRGDGYDACFWISDGSIPTLKSRKNILHFQIPFRNVNGKTLINKMKLFRVKHVVCNSEFTKGHIDKEFGVNSVVIYPPVSTTAFKPRKKENMILYVGRFSSLVQSKGHETLVEVFKKFHKRNSKWRMVLAGGVEIGASGIVEALKQEAQGYPIEILESPSLSELRALYGKAKMFWSAAGYGVDSQATPEKVEHFGIVVVEAMAAKAVPFVVARGGHPEIVEDQVSGFLWERKAQLLRQALDFSDNSKAQLSIARNSLARAGEFSDENFIRNFERIVIQ